MRERERERERVVERETFAPILQTQFFKLFSNIAVETIALQVLMS